MPNERGSKSKQTSTFMLPEDVAAFGRSLAKDIDGWAVWVSEPPRGGEPTAHLLLEDALAAGAGARAKLRLLQPDGTTISPSIYFDTSPISRTDGREVLADGRNVRVVDRETMHAGWLAYVWTPGEDSDEEWPRFNELANLAWRHLNKTTTADLAYHGKPRPNVRIGPAAKRWFQEDPARGLYLPALWLYLIDGDAS